MVVAMASSIFITAIPDIMISFDISQEVATLGVSLFVLGFVAGPLCWAPFSELKGRYNPLIVSVFGFTVFSFATANAKDIQSLFIFRFFAGFFGAGPLTLAGAVYSDIFERRARGILMVAFCLMVFIGPLTAPFVGGFIVINSHLGWRWTVYIPAILGSAALLLLLFTLDESYHPVILAKKADILRREMNDWSIRAKYDEVRLNFRAIVTEFAFRLLQMLLFDLIVLLMSIFASFVYGLLYLFLTAYPIIFQRIYGMNIGVGGLPYIGIIIGQLFGALAVFAMQPWILRKIQTNNGIMMLEWHLPIAIPGAVAFSAGLFWLGWTGYKR
jgi:DHA1 family multidrug resistance protein-like MFS transporter